MSRSYALRMGRRQRARNRTTGEAASSPAPKARRDLRSSPRPFRAFGSHWEAAWSASRASELGDPTVWRIRPLLAPIVCVLSFVGVGYGRWWRDTTRT